MTNHTPPKACLAGFGLTTMVFDPCDPMSSSSTLEGARLTFAAPELLAPSNYGLEKPLLTREGDIFTFALVILQVAVLRRRHLFCLFLTIHQVLMSEHPFRGMRASELAYHVPSGVRPPKPKDAEAIGISESLWELIQKCWDGDPRRRPRIQEVVKGVGNAAANWRVATLPSAVEHWEDSDEEEEDDLTYSEFSLVPVVPPVFKHFSQRGYGGLIRAMTRKS